MSASYLDSEMPTQWRTSQQNKVTHPALPTPAHTAQSPKKGRRTCRKGPSRELFVSALRLFKGWGGASEQKQGGEVKRSSYFRVLVHDSQKLHTPALGTLHCSCSECSLFLLSNSVICDVIARVCMEISHNRKDMWMGFSFFFFCKP